MSMLSLQFGKGGEIENPISSYQPSGDIKELSKIAQSDIEQGNNILNRKFNEFNGMNLIERMNRDQKDWLAWSNAPSDNPDEAWMYTGTSSVTRNKIISTAAHLSKYVMFPNVFAQNDEDEEDVASAHVMREAIEFNLQRRGYPQSFLYAVISGLVNPVSYFKVDYCQAFQEIIEGEENNYSRKKILDDVISGFNYSLIPADEILIANPYCFDLQRQSFLIHRRRISYGDAKALWSKNNNFQHIRPGIVSIYNNIDNYFYDVSDGMDDNLVEEVTLSYRQQDKQITFINGVYFSNPSTEWNPIKHRDNKNRPKYNIVKFGAEPIDAQRFWAYKSLASKLSNDKELVDRMRQNAVDASTFATFPSIFTMGAGKIDRNVFVPATVMDLNKDAKIQPATGLMNPSYAYQASKEAEQALIETSMDPQLAGQSAGVKTARESMLVQQNAITNLGIMLNMIGNELVKPIGELIVDDILRYQTVGEMMELGGGVMGMKYMSMVLSDKVMNGKRKSVIIRFTDAWAGRKMSEKEIRDESVRLYEESGEEKDIYEVNPAIWSKLNYMVMVEPDQLKMKNDSFDRIIKLEVYDRAIGNPLIANDPEKLAEVTRDLLFAPSVGGDATKYIPKDTERAMQGIIPQQKNSGMTKRIMQGNVMQGLEVNG